MNRHLNAQTQPFVTQPVFSNWDVVAEGWYIALPSERLGRKRATSVEVCGQKIALFRGEDGRVRALDAFCPHMGTDLGIGHVEGVTLRCFFHHWAFDERGACVDVPCGEPIPKKARVRAWPACEQLGFIWVFAGDEASTPGPVLPPSLQGEELVVWRGKKRFRPCHHHVNMINGLDAQHLRTVHGFHLDVEVASAEDDVEKRIDFVLDGVMPEDTFKERLARRILGSRYGYAMRYGHANVGALTLVKDTYLFDRVKLPEIFTLWAYRPIDPGKSEVQTLYLTRRRRGPLGWLWARVLLLVSALLYLALRDEDGAIYENIRFQPKNLLKVDGPVARYISYVNRLKPSPWSKAPRATSEGRAEQRPDDGDEAATRLRVVDGG